MIKHITLEQSIKLFEALYRRRQGYSTALEVQQTVKEVDLLAVLAGLREELQQQHRERGVDLLKPAVPTSHNKERDIFHEDCFYSNRQKEIENGIVYGDTGSSVQYAQFSTRCDSPYCQKPGRRIAAGDAVIFRNPSTRHRQA